MIKYWIRENFPQYEQYVKFDLTQFDPVPGTGSYADHARVDLLQDNREQLRQRMLALGDAAETTVFTLCARSTAFSSRRSRCKTPSG